MASVAERRPVPVQRRAARGGARLRRPVRGHSRCLLHVWVGKVLVRVAGRPDLWVCRARTVGRTGSATKPNQVLGGCLASTINCSCLNKLMSAKSMAAAGRGTHEALNYGARDMAVTPRSAQDPSQAADQVQRFQWLASLSTT